MAKFFVLFVLSIVIGVTFNKPVEEAGNMQQLNDAMFEEEFDRLFENFNADNDIKHIEKLMLIYCERVNPECFDSELFKYLLFQFYTSERNSDTQQSEPFEHYESTAEQSPNSQIRMHRINKKSSSLVNNRSYKHKKNLSLLIKKAFDQTKQRYLLKDFLTSRF